MATKKGKKSNGNGKKGNGFDTDLAFGSHNIGVDFDGEVLTFKVAVNKDFGLSKSQKTRIIASSRGNQKITLSGGKNVYLGLNLYEYANPK